MMTPAFISWQAFWAMGGYAFYVWLAVGITVVTLLLLVGHTLWQSKQTIRQIRQKMAREKRLGLSKEEQKERK